MTSSGLDLAGLREKLEAEQARLLHAAGYLQQRPTSMDSELGELSSGGSGDNHLADMASVTYDRELDEGLEEGVRTTLAQIDAALARMDEGTYGTCETCGKQIAPERLEAIPWTTRCIDDARR